MGIADTMEPAGKIYLAIDLKSYYASEECAERHLNPLTTNLVVADITRTEKTICLAVSPSLKALGIPGRARLFEVIQRVNQVNAERLQKAKRLGKVISKDGKLDFISYSYDAEALAADPGLGIQYITAPPHMERYLQVSAKIYSIYLKYVSEDDIYCYSIDEVFIDITHYLKTHKMTAHQLAMTMIREVLYTTGITATAGIGSNLYLAKVAMDIVAKHIPPDNDGVRIAELDEESFRYQLWNHKPLTDFWRTGPGTAARLNQHGIYTMGDLARVSTYDQEWFYRTFGIDAEILIDHAWGLEPCTMQHIKSYVPKTNCVSEGQVLTEPTSYSRAKVVLKGMANTLAYRLMDIGMVTESITLYVGYDRESLESGNYLGPVTTDHYGRAVPKSSHGTTKLDAPSNLSNQIEKALLVLFDKIVDKSLLVRRFNLTANNVTKDEGIVQLDFFTDTTKLEKQRKLQQTMLAIQKKYNKNAILKGTDYEEGSTTLIRNDQIGGHKK